MISLSLALPKLPSPPSLKPPHPSRQNLSPPPPALPKALNARLIHHLDGGNLHQAISTLELMVEQGTHPDLITYTLLLKSCIRTRNFHLGKILHSKLAQSPLQLDSFMLNSLISLYSKSNDWETAHSIFHDMGTKRDLVSWSSMIACYANNGMRFESILVFLGMLENGFYPNEFCFSAVIRACSCREYLAIGEAIFGFALKCGYFEDVRFGCGLIDMFVKGGRDLDSALKVFDKMPERNEVTWTLMITRFAQFGFTRDSVDLFLDMLLSGHMPDKYTLTSVISVCSELESMSMGRQLHSWAIRSGLALDVCVGCSLVDMYSKCAVDGSVCDSRKVFDRMEDHNVMSWTAIITGYVQSKECSREAIDLFCEMIQGHVPPNHLTFSSTLKACANLSDSQMGEQVYAYAVKLGLASVNCVGNSLISMYARSGRTEDARKAFDVLFEKNLVSYNTMVDVYAKNSNYNEAFELFHQGEEMGFGTSAFTFASLLSGAASIGAIGKGEQIHARSLKSGFGSDTAVCNALISMYSRCGNVEAALQVFGEMEDRNIISWTSMIGGLAKHGFATRALEMFHKMLEAGTRPNEITYIAVLSACSHVGLISEGWKYFRSMYNEHGIVPRMDHYACMVDLLGRAGSLVEAIEFIRSMPFKADALVWRTFLGACRVHGNIELGEHAAKMILELEPRDPAAYILLSNLYASTGHWEDSAKIRRDMKHRKLSKEAGCSWIEVENEVHKFHVGETSHPQTQEIYDELDRLALKIKEVGYVPNTDFVLHDVEDELGEHYLFQHSEKIAVAFGLISTSKSKPIRIFKNLRVCGDCHTAIKYISRVTGRQIVVRDSNRFHHIKDGTCSCNDYW